MSQASSCSVFGSRLLLSRCRTTCQLLVRRVLPAALSCSLRTLLAHQLMPLHAAGVTLVQQHLMARDYPRMDIVTSDAAAVTCRLLVQQHAYLAGPNDAA